MENPWLFLDHPYKINLFFNWFWNFCLLFSIPFEIPCPQLPLFGFFYRMVIEMCLASSILKEIRGGWISSYQVLLFFMLRQLKKIDSLRNSDEVAWNFAISEANLFRSSRNNFYKTFLKNFVKYTEKDLCQSLLFKTFCNFKRRFWHKCFPLNAFSSLLTLPERLVRKYTKPTTRMLVQ